ncbi:WhiB family transcriptional regulator [Rhodococcus sp. NPDC057014]|uniref:WhiB family transcriptional regulator n=1 Tax=unclassified Rhodococcus (in: high G+C Gram-positive bacteria) TaxID=192944 RepID=UPI0036317DDF
MSDHSHHHTHVHGNWQDRASCRGTDPDVFFSSDGERRRVRAQREHTAKQICQECPVLTDCRTHALTAAETHGIWGGLSENERARHTRRTRLAARTPGARRSTAPSVNPTSRTRPSNS